MVWVYGDDSKFCLVKPLSIKQYCLSPANAFKFECVRFFVIASVVIRFFVIASVVIIIISFFSNLLRLIDKRFAAWWKFQRLDVKISFQYTAAYPCFDVSRGKTNKLRGLHSASEL
jgi:hypothetical protein